jgi:hypothetical protein
MQLLKLVIFNVSIEVSAVYGIRIILERDGAIFFCTRMPGGYYAFMHDASVVRSGTVIVCVVSGETPMADLPQRAVIFIVVGRILIAFEAVWEGSRRPGLLTLLTREEVNASLQYCPTFEAVVPIFIDPLRLGWTLCCVDAWDKIGGR